MNNIIGLSLIRLCIICCILLQSLSLWAQVTTSSVGGRVTDGQEPLIGVTIVALHDESGTQYAGITNALEQRYRRQHDSGASNNGNLLQFMKTNENNEPVYTMPSIIVDESPELPTRSTWVSRKTSQCWQMII